MPFPSQIPFLTCFLCLTNSYPSLFPLNSNGNSFSFGGRRRVNHFNRSFFLSIRGKAYLKRYDPNRLGTFSFKIIVSLFLSQKTLFYKHCLSLISELKKKKPLLKRGFAFGAANRGRTGTVLPPRDFKSLASAYSAIAAQST